MDRVVKHGGIARVTGVGSAPNGRQDLATGGLFHADGIASNVPIDRAERRE